MALNRWQSQPPGKKKRPPGNITLTRDTSDNQQSSYPSTTPARSTYYPELDSQHSFQPMTSLVLRAVVRNTARPVVATTASSTHCRHRQNFHSYDHPIPASSFGATESEILSAAYKHVPEHGFTTRSLGLGARDAGYLDISPSVLSDGAFSLIRHHLVTQRLRLAETNKQLFNQDTPGSAGSAGSAGSDAKSRVAALTWERLIANKDVVHQWQEVRRTL